MPEFIPIAILSIFAGIGAAWFALCIFAAVERYVIRNP